jgi:kynurenine formamidase
MDIASISLERLYGPATVVDISREVADLGLITPGMIERTGRVSDGDILLIHTGYHRFYAGGTEANLDRYFFRHPGGDGDLARWVVERGVRWLGVDMASPDHPMNSNLAVARPELAAESEKVLGRSLAELFPPAGHQVMHVQLFEHDVPIVENLSGRILEVLAGNEVCAFPWRFVGGEAAMVRVVAFVDG